MSPFRPHPPPPLHQHLLIDLRYLLFLQIRCNSQLRDWWLASTILKLVIPTNTPVPNFISARVINDMPGCNIAFGGPVVSTEPSPQDSESESEPGKRKQPSAEALAAKTGLHGFGISTNCAFISLH